MIVPFSRWGNSLALRIPAQVLRDVGAAEGSTADLSVEQGRIVIAPRGAAARYVRRLARSPASPRTTCMTIGSMGGRPVTKSGDPPCCPDLGDVVFFDFSRHLGTEQGFTRPGLVLTPRSYDGLVGRCLACPVTRRGRGYPCEAALPSGLKIHGFVLADQGNPLTWAELYARFVDVAPADLIDDVKAKIAAFLQRG